MYRNVAFSSVRPLGDSGTNFDSARLLLSFFCGTPVLVRKTALKVCAIARVFFKRRQGLERGGGERGTGGGSATRSNGATRFR